MEELEIKIIDPADKRLRVVSEEVTDFDNGYESIINKMKEICLARKAYASAAPQFGINKRFILIMTEEEIKDIDKEINYNVNAYFNPKIRVMRGCQEFYESCMSVPNTIGKVKRPYYIELDAQDIKGNPIHKKAEGFEAIILCHEIDHLDGIEYTNKASDLHYGIDVDARMQIRKEHPHCVISKDGEYNQEEIQPEFRTKHYPKE